MMKLMLKSQMSGMMGTGGGGGGLGSMLSKLYLGSQSISIREEDTD